MTFFTLNKSLNKISRNQRDKKFYNYHFYRLLLLLEYLFKIHNHLHKKCVYKIRPLQNCNFTNFEFRTVSKNVFVCTLLLFLS